MEPVRRYPILERRHIERFTTIITKIELLKSEFAPGDELHVVLETAKRMLVSAEDRCRERVYGSG